MDRKGMGMELALLVLLVVFACSILLVSSALIGKENLQTKEFELTHHILLDELAEKVLAVEDGDYSEIAEDLRYAGLVVYEKKGDEQWNMLWTDIAPLQPEGFVLNVRDANRYLVISDVTGIPRMSVALKDETILRWSYN